MHGYGPCRSRRTGDVERVRDGRHRPEPAVEAGHFEHATDEGRDAGEKQPAVAGSERLFHGHERTKPDTGQVADLGDVEHPEGGVAGDALGRLVETFGAKSVEPPAQHEHRNPIIEGDAYVHGTCSITMTLIQRGQP